MKWIKLLSYTLSIALLGMGTIPLYGQEQGAVELKAPASEKVQQKAEADEEKIEKKDQEEKTEKKDKEKEEKKPTKTLGNFSLSLGFGHYTVKSSGTDWRASGAGDIAFGYKIPNLPFPLYGTIRYIGSDVSPRIKINGQSKETLGVMEGYYLGSLGFFPINDHFWTAGGLEFGFLTYKLVDQFDLNQTLKTRTYTFSGTLRGGGFWAYDPSFMVGPDITIGYGSGFTMLIALRGIVSF